ncbi:unnamed protein product [Musa hybrid cultivar]
MSNTMEDSGAILREISSFKDMLDQVNEEIEKNIQRTREIESEILKLSEIEDGHIMRECELSKIITIRGFELEASIQVAAISRASAESMERESGSLKINRDIIEKRIYDKRYFLESSFATYILNNLVRSNFDFYIFFIREKFILQCCEFQDDMTIAKNNELSRLLSEKKALENEKQTVTKKMTALENSTEELIEEILQEIHKSNSALDAEIHNQRSEYMRVIDDINDLRILLGSISSFEDS